MFGHPLPGPHGDPSVLFSVPPRRHPDQIIHFLDCTSLSAVFLLQRFMSKLETKTRLFLDGKFEISFGWMTLLIGKKIIVSIEEVLPLIPPIDLGCSASCDRSGSSTVIIPGSPVTSCNVVN